MSPPGILHAMTSVLDDLMVAEILETNGPLKEYGLSITPPDAKELLEVRNQALQSHGRVELDAQATRKLILGLCNSPFIDQENYLPTLRDLVEVFYYMKNETEDQVGDDELITIILDFYDNSCEGSVELLIGRDLETFARSIRRRQAMCHHTKGGD